MRTGPNHATIEILGSLNGFFPSNNEQYLREVKFRLHPAARDLIESQGVPHVEVYAMKVNGRFRSLDYNVQSGDRLAVYPREVASGLDKAQLLKSTEAQHTQFIADVHLGKLVRLLRLMGIDTAYSNAMDDQGIVEKAVHEGRAVLSRDLGVLKNGALTYGYWPRSEVPDQQILEVISYFDLQSICSPFSRCLACNGLLQEVDATKIEHRIPEKVRQWHNENKICNRCDKIYWKGSHYEDLKQKVKRILEQG